SSAPAQNWGDGARFSTNSRAPTIGDWDGDGLDDLAYQGICGGSGKAHQCWRVHSSRGDSFTAPEDWGATPARQVKSMPVDLDGDGRDDLLFQSECEDESCWFVQLSDGKSFGEPMRAGRVSSAESRAFRFFDFDGNGTDDVISWATGDDESRIEARFGSATGLSKVVVLARIDGPIDEVHLERAGGHAPARASVRLPCGDDSCVETLFATSSRSLVDGDHYRSAMLGRRGVPIIT
ncbi:MAG TPA: FG-GAP-like repeat-containing protein, partial [Acidimicrobiia bacterium]